MSKFNMNWYILKVYAERPIAFIPVLARLAGSVGAGLFMSQMLYWCGKGYKGDWVYKTIEEFKLETCLSRSEQERAIKKWQQLGVLEKELWGVPPIRHFRIDVPALEKLLNVAFRIDASSQTNGTNGQNTITESTTEKTNKYPANKKLAVHVDHF